MGWEVVVAMTIAIAYFIAMATISLWEKVSSHRESRES